MKEISPKYRAKVLHRTHCIGASDAFRDASDAASDVSDLSADFAIRMGASDVGVPDASDAKKCVSGPLGRAIGRTVSDVDGSDE